MGNTACAILDRADRAIIQSRMNALAVVLGTTASSRRLRMAHVLARLPGGAYLLGTGPNTAGIIPLTVDEILIGREAARKGERAWSGRSCP
jgi:hypothetical protein